MTKLRVKELCVQVCVKELCVCVACMKALCVEVCVCVFKFVRERITFKRIEKRHECSRFCMKEVCVKEVCVEVGVFASMSPSATHAKRRLMMVDVSKCRSCHAKPRSMHVAKRRACHAKSR